MNVTKIKIKKDRVSIDYDKMVVVDEKELVNKYSIDSPEHPTNAFKNAFQKMDFFLIELCELCDKPKDIPIMCEDVNITGLSFKYDEGELSGAVITGTKALAYSNSPLILNTPHKSVNVDGIHDKMFNLTGSCIAALKAVIDHAIDYVGGERLQIELDLQNDERPKEVEKPQTDDPNFGKGDEKVQSENLGPQTLGEPVKEEVSRETVKTADDMPEDEWAQHPHNPDSPNFIGDAAIQQKDDFEDDGINTTKDVRDDSEETNILRVPGFSDEVIN